MRVEGEGADAEYLHYFGCTDVLPPPSVAWLADTPVPICAIGPRLAWWNSVPSLSSSLVEFLATKPPPVMNVPVEDANVNVAVPRPAAL